MPAYVIVAVASSLSTDDAARILAEYRDGNTEQVAAHGGSFVVRGGEVERLEGDLNPLRVVVIEFADRATARAWHASPGYAPLKAMRQSVSTLSMILVEGPSPSPA